MGTVTFHCCNSCIVSIALTTSDGTSTKPITCRIISDEVNNVGMLPQMMSPPSSQTTISDGSRSFVFVNSVQIAVRYFCGEIYVEGRPTSRKSNVISVSASRC